MVTYLYPCCQQYTIEMVDIIKDKNNEKSKRRNKEAN
jgi:hypothetical protein